MKTKSKIFSSIALFGSSLFALILVSPGVSGHLFSAKANQEYLIELSNTKNDYAGSGTQKMKTELENEVNFSFVSCEASSNDFVKINENGYLYNSEQITSIESILPEFSTDSGARLMFRASYKRSDSNLWGEWTELTSKQSFRLSSHPYYFELKALGGAVYLNNMSINFTCIANPDADNPKVSEPIFDKGVVTESTDYSGTYLVVSEENNIAFDTTIDTLDSQYNYVSVTINKTDNTINYDENLEEKSITINKITKKGNYDTTYSIKLSNGKYIGNDSYSNFLTVSDDPLDNYVYFEDGQLVVEGKGGSYLAYNNNYNGYRFRYMKSVDESSNNYLASYYKLSGKTGGGGKPAYDAGITYTDDKTSYNVREKFADFVGNGGLTVSALMSDGTTKPLSPSQYSYTLTYAGEQVSPNSTFPHAGQYEVTISYGQITPIKYFINVKNVVNSIVAYKDVKSYALNAYVDYSDLSVIKWYYVDGTSNEIPYSDFTSNNISYSLINPSGNTVAVNSQLSVVGNWTIRVSLNATIYSDITIDVASVAVESITLNKSTSTIIVGNTDTLTATVLPPEASDKTVTWTTSNSAIASVNNGVVRGVSAGTATITAKAGSLTASCEVTVEIVPVTGVTISNTTLELNVGDQSTLSATIEPDYATNTSVTWSVTSGDAVTVTNDGVVSAIKAGEARVQVKTNDGEYTATCTVTVSNIAVTGITLSPKTLTLYQNGDKGSLSATISPASATDKSVTWVSNHPEIAAVIGSGTNIQINPVAAGTATITATSSNGLSDTCEVTVSDSVPTWTLVTGNTDLVAGNKYVLAQNTEGVTAGDISGSFLSSVNTTFSSDKQTITSLGAGTVQFTLSGSANNWKLNNDSGNTLSATAAKNLIWNGVTDTWTINIDSDHDATIYSTNSGYGRFLYNAGSPRFTTYTSSTSNTMLMPQLYVMKMGGGSGTTLVTTINVSPKSSVLDPGETVALNATVIPSDATNPSVSWSSDDKNVATVSQSGVVTAVAAGTTTITATAKDGSGVTGTATITVSEAKLTSIEVSNIKDQYYVGDSFVKPTVTANFSDGTHANVTYDATFTGFSTTSAGSCTVTVSYTHNGITKTTAFTVTITSSGGTVIEGDEYQITFKSAGSDDSQNLNSSTLREQIQTGSDYILSFNSMDKVYKGTSGIKMGSSSSKGYIDFNTSSTISDNQATGIKLDIAQYGTVAADVNVYINNSDTPTLTVNSGTSTSGSVAITGTVLIDRIKVVAAQRAYLKGISISTKPVEPVDPTGISVNPSSLVMTRNETAKLSVSFTPTNANQNKTITWSSSNASIVTVSSDGTVTARANGTATITATGYRGITSTCSVEVKDIAVSSVSVSPTSATISINSTKQLNASISPSNATNQGITWSSSNQNYATVDSNGLVTGKAKGTVTITATSQADATKKATAQIEVTEIEQDKWTVLMYVCGADLESESGLASGDFDEICKVNNKPDDVNIVIQTGGAKSWSKYGINASNNQRYHVENKTLVCDNSKVYNSYTSMGSSSTLADFVGWGMKEYPAEKTALIFWNHGGGMRGVCYDEKKSDDNLNNSELRSGISSGLTKAGVPSGTKLEWVGFDACLMAVQDIAEFLSPYANYMVASEESEAGYGWDYDNWVDDLYAKKDTTVILKAICDSFISDNGGTSSSRNDQTLSFLNLAYAQAYKEAWEAMAAQCSSKATSRSEVISIVGSNVKHYADGDYNYFHLFDAYDFVNKIASNYLKVDSSYTSAVLNFFNGSSKVSSSVNNSKFVCYTSCGAGAGESHGLCCLYVYTQDRDYATINSYYTTSMTNFTTWRTFCRNYGDLD